MEMTIIDKLIIIFKYVFSSFMGIELLLISLLLFILLILNIRRNAKILKIFFFLLYTGFLITMIVLYTPYAKESIDSLVKSILTYIYFPSMVMYFFIVITTTIILMYSIFLRKLPKFKKIVNISFCSLMYFFFINVIAIALSKGIDLSATIELYKNEQLLAFIQCGNIIFYFFIEYTLIYWLYKYFQKKLD